ncbi:hypothetical protein L0664_04940 [Octadecabacter sp. G9-8]|uniref:Uncharacterized protein n=1 Tax=Octadecabacter dasysiphoniae TaxID=2909341 RepID=A0ABS9CVH0_9RHOB|nr:hypothetical protein [Octadecabacter dasysiphoniae]MCF2870405.1 hypothetical protein [Octadecabacter dasysiphoniae]
MAIIHFCNCVGQPIELVLNSQDVAEVVQAGAITPETGELSLPMWSIEAAPAPVSDGVLFSQYDKNVLTVVTPLPTVNLYDIELTSEMRNQDLYFYVFPRTLVGQNAQGETKGISIDLHTKVRRQVQGAQVNEGLGALPELNFGSHILNELKSDTD